MTGHPVAVAWNTMRMRCRNPNVREYKYYGARGIDVCERWDSIENFLADMLPTWQRGLSLDRIDNDRGYSPDNCRWVPKSEQPKNRRSVVFLETPWGRLSKAETARRIGISEKTLHERLRRNWSEDMLFSPKQAKYDPRGGA